MYSYIFQILVKLTKSVDMDFFSQFSILNSLSHTTFESNRQKFLRLNCKFHRQFV